jgi:hypothetical protein
VSTDETEHRTGMERRATEDDGTRLRTEQENAAHENAAHENAAHEDAAHENAAHENAAKENHVRGDEGTRPMRTE